MKVETFKKPVSVPMTSLAGKKEVCVRKGMPLIRFDAHKNPFLMNEQYCTNPECNCNVAILSFVEINKSGLSVNPTHFTIYLDTETWQENPKTEDSKNFRNLIEEFLQGLTNEMKDSFRRKYEETRSAVNFDIPINRIEDGEMVAYSEVFGGGSIVYGGNEASFRFEYNKKTYAIDDLYCINPKCNCKEVLLVFLEFSEETKTISRAFEAQWSFNNKLQFNTYLNYTKDHALKIFKEWQRSDPDVFDLLKNRYKEIKAIGQRLIAKNAVGKSISSDFRQTDEKKKIGRNDPCLCGSGKKYKKCCGK